MFVGLFHAEESELNRSFPLPAMHAIAATGAIGGAIVRHGVALGRTLGEQRRQPLGVHVKMARELVVDRTLLVSRRSCMIESAVAWGRSAFSAIKRNFGPRRGGRWSVWTCRSRSSASFRAEA